MPHRVELKISSDPRWLRTVRAMMQEVSREVGFTERERCDIMIAVDEALANVMKHAYKGDPNGPVSLSCIAEDGRLEIVLCDQGEACDPKNLEPPPPEEMRVGGRGIFLMRSTMDEVSFERNGNHNYVRLRKRVKPQGG
ncbi:MAG: ATP-binding protein [Acidobacteria bacterium]|nr:ATP-binding protein [Acidobacteriota bacterium]